MEPVMEGTATVKACWTCGSAVRTDGSTSRKLLKCQQCLLALYCSKEHQRDDWKTHSIRCKAPRSESLALGPVGSADATDLAPGPETGSSADVTDLTQAGAGPSSVDTGIGRLDLSAVAPSVSGAELPPPPSTDAEAELPPPPSTDAIVAGDGAVSEPPAFDAIVAVGDDLLAAVDGLRAGGSVLLAAGAHSLSGPLSIKRPVFLFGRGAALLTSRSPTGSVLISSTSKGAVCGITIIGKSANAGCVVILSGALRLQDSSVTGQDSACIVIKGKGKPIIIDCRIVTGTASAIVINGGATAVLDGITVTSKVVGMKAGIQVSGGASAVIRRTTVRGPSQAGLRSEVMPGMRVAPPVDSAESMVGVAVDAGCVTVENSVMERCGMILAEANGSSITNTTISGSASGGLMITKTKSVSVRDCDIFNNADCDLSVSESTPDIERCKFHDGARAAVCIFKGGGGNLKDCEIWNAGCSGIEIARSANPRVTNCNVKGCLDGIMVCAQGKGVVTGCTISGARQNGIQVIAGSSPTIQNCSIHDCHDGGVVFKDASAGSIANCESYNHAFAGMVIMNRSTTAVSDCKVHDNRDAGIVIGVGATPVITNCEVWGHTTDSGFHIESEARPTLRGNNSRGNKNGILIGYNARRGVANQDWQQANTFEGNETNVFRM